MTSIVAVCLRLNPNLENTVEFKSELHSKLDAVFFPLLFLDTFFLPLEITAKAEPDWTSASPQTQTDACDMCTEPINSSVEAYLQASSSCAREAHPRFSNLRRIVLFI